VTDEILVVDSVTGHRVSGLTIQSISTGESHASGCSAVAFANASGLAKTYATLLGVGTDCVEGFTGTWAASPNTMLPVGGGTLTAIELFDQVTVDSEG